MQRSAPVRNVGFLWQDRRLPSKFRTGVSLHGHTHHSKECLDFLPTHLRRAPGLGWVVDGYERPGKHSTTGVNFARAYWTPPMTPSGALGLERKQIESHGLEPLVSITDHDDIEACIALQVTGREDTPISTEWTVPYEKAILHFGIHNLRGDSARRLMSDMAAFTAAPNEEGFPAILEALAADPQVLVVLNHPFWLEEGIKEVDRERAVARIGTECSSWIHALELNGTRPWRENRDTIDLAHAWGKPVISGGDRHGCEPAAAINLTDAETFVEFVGEVRDGRSEVCFMPQYREPMALRILETARDILRTYPGNAGRERWIDRIFYKCNDGMDRSLAVLWQGEVPFALRGVHALVETTGNSGVKSALRLLGARGERIAL